jgi:L-rhamnose mutarotase
MREDGQLFGYFEAAESFQTSLEEMSQEDINTRWQEFMTPYFEGIDGVAADEQMIELEEVVHLD